jgi:hypothetical protein
MTDINPLEIAHCTMYRLMVSLVVPRPVAFTTSMNRAGLRNAYFAQRALDDYTYTDWVYGY